MKLDIPSTKDKCIEWTREWFKNNGDAETKAVIGISGGTDSTVTAAVCVAALGRERVVGVMMPNGEQKDISDSIKVCETLGIENYTINIGPAYEALTKAICTGEVNSLYSTNTPARIRMATLYGKAAEIGNARVANTCNLSEDYVGYSTKWGDATGDFSPLSKLTKTEVVAIGDALGLPYELTHKAPSDGMCGKTDEDNLGFTYDELDKYIRNTEAVSPKVVEKIEKMHKNPNTAKKLVVFDVFDPEK